MSRYETRLTKAAAFEAAAAAGQVHTRPGGDGRSRECLKVADV